MSMYDTQTECDCGNHMVEAEGLPHNLDVDPDTADAINEAVNEGEGRVVLSAPEMARNEWYFTESQAKEAEKEGGYTLNIHVPDCPECGSDQDHHDDD